MNHNYFTEDLFMLVVDGLDTNKTVIIPVCDDSTIRSFKSKIINNEPFTILQSTLLMQLITRYSRYVNQEISTLMQTGYKPNFKLPLIDPIERRSITVVNNGNNSHVVQISIPETAKNSLFDEILEFTVSNVHISKLLTNQQLIITSPIWTFNIIALNEFVKKKNFKISGSFTDLVLATEDAWNNIDKILPHAIINDNDIELVNYHDSANKWLLDNKSQNLYKNMLIAKSIGHNLLTYAPPTNIVEKIAKSNTNIFWTTRKSDIIDIYKISDPKIAILLKSHLDINKWVIDFVTTAINSGIPSTDIKVCYRVKTDLLFNKWITDTGVGGTVASGKIFLFKDSIPKWAIAKNTHFDVLVTNSVYTASSNITTRLPTHHCTVHITDTPPHCLGNTYLVNL